MAKGKQKFYCRKSYERTVGFNNRLQRLVNVLHCFDALLKLGVGGSVTDSNLMVLNTGNRRNKGAFTCIFQNLL